MVKKVMVLEMETKERIHRIVKMIFMRKVQVLNGSQVVVLKEKKLIK